MYSTERNTNQKLTMVDYTSSNKNSINTFIITIGFARKKNENKKDNQ